MKQFAKLVVVSGALGATLGACIIDARAQAYPNKPIRLIVSVQPGGNLDLIGRSVADKMSEGLGQRMYVENRPGANSTIGLASAARSAPDGYTFVMVAQSALIAAMMMRNPPYDPDRYGNAERRLRYSANGSNRPGSVIPATTSRVGGARRRLMWFTARTATVNM